MSNKIANKQQVKSTLSSGFISTVELMSTKKGIEVTIKTTSEDIKVLDENGEPVLYASPSDVLFSLSKYDVSVVNADVTHIH